MRILITLAALVVAGCSSDRVPPADAHQALKLFELAPDGSGGDREQEIRVLLEGCGELKSCAAGCEKALAAAVHDGIDREQRGRIVAECFADFRNEHDKDSSVTTEAWFSRYMARYANRVRSALDTDDQKRLDAAVGKLGLTSAK